MSISSRLPRPTRLVLVVALVVIVVGVIAVRSLTGGSQNISVTARFDSAAGLYTGNSVDVLGMKVGTVTAITQRGSYVEVRMNVTRSVPIPANATAVTVSDSVLTDRHVEFTPAYHSGPVLSDGAELGLDRTRTPIAFDNVLAMADKLSKSLAGDGAGHGPIAGLVGLGSDIAGQDGADISSALDQLSAALRMGDDHGTATRDAITRIVNDLDSLAATAARNDQQIRQFGSAIHQTSDFLAAQNLGSGDTGAQLNQILSTASDLLQRNRASLAQTTGNAAVVTRSLSDYQRSIAEYMDLFPLVTDNAYRVMDTKQGFGRVHIDVDKVLLDGQMVKEVCNLLNMKQLGCDTGKMSDMGPDFGVVAMLAGIAGLPK